MTFWTRYTQTWHDSSSRHPQSHARLLPGDYDGVKAIQADESDNVFLAAALEAGADYLVTQDPHLLRLKYFHGTHIISLAQFAHLLTI